MLFKCTKNKHSKQSPCEPPSFLGYMVSWTQFCLNSKFSSVINSTIGLQSLSKYPFLHWWYDHFLSFKGRYFYIFIRKEWSFVQNGDVFRKKFDAKRMVSWETDLWKDTNLRVCSQFASNLLLERPHPISGDMQHMVECWTFCI